MIFRGLTLLFSLIFGFWCMDTVLAHALLFNTALTASEQDSALREPGSITRKQVLWLPLDFNDPARDLSVNGSYAKRFGDLRPGPTGPWSDYYTNPRKAAA